MIYFLQSVDGGPIKIGYTENLETRRVHLEGQYGQKLAVLRTMEGGYTEERAIHQRFQHLRLGHTEQFQPAPDLMEFINRPLLVDPNPGAVEAMPVRHRKIVAAFKAGPEFEAWFLGFVEQQRMPASCVIERALILFAEWQGYDKKPPYR